jgi:hypothetical protein
MIEATLSGVLKTTAAGISMAYQQPSLATTAPRYLLLSYLNMVRPERFELPTFWFVARRSIQLS